MLVVGMGTIVVGDAGIAGVDPLTVPLSLSLFARLNGAVLVGNSPHSLLHSHLQSLKLDQRDSVIVVVIGGEDAGGEDTGNVDDGVVIERGMERFIGATLPMPRPDFPPFHHLSHRPAQLLPPPASSSLSLSLVLASAFALPLSRF